MHRRAAGNLLRARAVPVRTPLHTPRVLPRPSPSQRAALSPRLLPTRNYASSTAATATAPTDPAQPAQPSTPSPNGPLAQYDAMTASGRLRDDPHQRGIVAHLDRLHAALTSYQPPKVVYPPFETLVPHTPTFWEKLTRKEPPRAPQTEIPANMPKGLYLYGDVGSGKTMLMDMFFSTLPAHIRSRNRIHFHHFMQDVHRRLHRLKLAHGADFDGLPHVGAEIAERSAVLCFDEFQCTDVADAMILRRLLHVLASHGVVMVATSNRHPRDLYRNGIQRESFLPCIELLQTKLDVICLDSPTDYRQIPRPAASVYHHPLDANADDHAAKWFRYFADPKNPEGSPAAHEIWGREIRVPRASGQAAMFTFTELCGSPLSAADYLELCRHYRSFVITGVPSMSYKTRDLARRFITFVDAAYESRAKLVLTMETGLTGLFTDADDAVKDQPLDSSMRMMMDDLGLSMEMLKSSSIFTGDEERFAFARALSRLAEMSSEMWVERKD